MIRSAASFKSGPALTSDEPASHLEMGAALGEEEAEALFAAAVERFPADPAIAAGRASLRRWEEALARRGAERLCPFLERPIPSQPFPQPLP